MKKTLIHLMALSGIVAMTNCAASKKGKNLHANCKTECAKENKTCKSKDNQSCWLMERLFLSPSHAALPKIQRSTMASILRIWIHLFARRMISTASLMVVG